jgi:hypothetical protein
VLPEEKFRKNTESPRCRYARFRLRRWTTGSIIAKLRRSSTHEDVGNSCWDRIGLACWPVAFIQMVVCASYAGATRLAARSPKPEPAAVSPMMSRE